MGPQQQRYCCIAKRANKGDVELNNDSVSASKCIASFNSSLNLLLVSHIQKRRPTVLPNDKHRIQITQLLSHKKRQIIDSVKIQLFPVSSVSDTVRKTTPAELQKRPKERHKSIWRYWSPVAPLPSLRVRSRGEV
jgi:hypothetical protein